MRRNPVGTTIIHKGVIYRVRRLENGTFVYRDAAHWGGPWSDVARTLANRSIDRAFRRALRGAAKSVA